MDPRLSDLQDEIDGKRRELNKLGIDCDEVEAEIAELNSNLYSLEDEMSNLDEEIKELEDQLTELEEAIENGQEDVDYVNPKWLEQKESLFDFVEEEAS